MANYERIPNREQEAETKPEAKFSSVGKGEGAPPPGVSIGWPANGMPVADPAAQRSEWETGLFSCLGKNDEFYSSDLEVCLLGSVAPCVLHASNVERLGSGPGTFANHCLPYTGLYLLGNCLFGWNCLAPWFSYTNRTAIRHKFNLEGSLGKYVMDEIQHEQCEASCDFCTHVFCHPCALCQEAREVRRRLPHPGLPTQQPVLVMIPPGGQAMGRAV
ncbi:PLAC8 family protein [Striga hermonthica]|uniref:PLAC8 family protein n=1 Tax=Striga hermonthica TaxID=68872 RepID=A0A9N7NIQ9_STRHE|nr:PLAC8 family protein [Striga hermonthica]